MPTDIRKPLDPVFSTNITRILLNWGMIDNFAGLVLAEMCGLGNSEDATDLIHIVPLERKLKLIYSRRDKHPNIPKLLFTEVNWINEKSRPLRNLIVHGILHLDFETDEPLGFISLSKDFQEILIEDVPLVATHSAYAHKVVSSLFKILKNIPVDVSELGIQQRPKELPLKAKM